MISTARNRHGQSAQAGKLSPAILMFFAALLLTAWSLGASAAAINVNVGWSPHPEWADPNQAKQAVDIHIYCANLTAGEQVQEPAAGTTLPGVTAFQFQRQANGGDVIECKLKAERDGLFSVFTAGVQAVVPFGIPVPPTGLSVDIVAQ